jgi:DNA-binding GntR family transcriptional regulator
MKRSATARAGAPAPHVTKQQYAYDTLRTSILKGELAPGTRLVIDDLARHFSISIIPVREALRLLQSEGLVLSVAHVGATVAPISRASVAEVFTLLEGLEVVAARTAAERATPAALDDLATIIGAMDQELDDERPQRWAELNTSFHLAISDMTAMPMLQEMMQRAFDHWGRVRTFYFSGVLVHRARRAQAEHHLMLDYLRTRNLPALEAVVREHNQAALAAYTAYLDSAASTPAAIVERGA